jgi:hypothetical protein
MDRRNQSQSPNSIISNKRQVAGQSAGSNQGGGVRMGGNQSARPVNWSSSTLLIKAVWIDSQGRKWLRQVPVGHEDEAQFGIELGPPDISGLGLSESISIKLHNELFNRNLITWDDVKQRPGEVQAALQAALKVDAGMIMGLYKNEVI